MVGNKKDKKHHTAHQNLAEEIRYTHLRKKTGKVMVTC